MEYNFFAMISRMKYIDRWALMRNTREENLCEHSLEVSIIAHALAVIGNTYYEKDLMGYFKDIAKIREASVDELMQVSSMNRNAAEMVYEFFHKE